MTNTQPLVSIIIPCYNTAAYIRETLESVYNQTYQNFEIIAIDDGSTDNTLEILHECAVAEPRLKVIAQENTYCVKARIHAIQYAQGDYLVCLDSDDILEKNYLKVCVEAAEENKDLAIIYTDAILFDAKNKPWKLPEFKLPDFLLQNCIYITALIRKTHYNAVGGFDSNMTFIEDWELFISIIKNGGKVKRIHQPLFLYRQRIDESSVSNLASDTRLSDNMLRIYNKHYEFYKENGIFFQSLTESMVKQYQVNRKKYNHPFRKYFYKWFKPKKYQKIQAYLE